MKKKVEKFYAVKKGYNTGIFRSWEECKKQVDRFSSPIYKSFLTYEEAYNYLNPQKENIYREVELIAYVDGSYNKFTKEFSYGMVILDGDKQKHFSEKFSDKGMAEMRNVAGEILGAMKAMEYCFYNNKKSIKICYDYEGIEKWCTGDWRTNKEETKKYKNFFDSINSKITIIFEKVKAHSGNKYNDLADELAKNAFL